jgi:ABC-type oligopeptide transport system substrate-binding subunit
MTAMKLTRRTSLKALAVAAVVPVRGSAQPGTSAPQKVLRYAFPIAETGMDPAQLTDLYSRILTAHLFDGLYEYDHLARPFLIKPNTADGMP